MRSLSLSRANARPRLHQALRAMLVGVDPELSVVVVHHRTPAVLAECLARLERAAPDAEMVLVDTAPDADVVAQVQHRAPAVTVVPAPNHSLAHAVNLGIRETHGSFVVVMNADVYVEPDTFARLLAAARADAAAGVLGPLPRTPAGRRQDLGLAYHPHYLRLARSRAGDVRVPWLSGCLQVIRREALERCGGYDASLRFYNEDMEFCLRLRAAGWHCRLVDAPVVHLGGTSTPDDPAFLVEGVRGGYQLTRRYLPAAMRPLHRSALVVWGTVGALVARRPERRAALARIARMARRQRFDDSPFGVTLSDRTPEA